MSIVSPTRRGVLVGTGSLAISFSFPVAAEQGGARDSGGSQQQPPLPGSLATQPFLDGWIAIDEQGHVTVMTGKVELGQGLKTAIRQIAAEELELAPSAIAIVTADTARTANEGYTAGSSRCSTAAGHPSRSCRSPGAPYGGSIATPSPRPGPPEGCRRQDCCRRRPTRRLWRACLRQDPPRRGHGTRGLSPRPKCRSWGNPSRASTFLPRSRVVRPGSGPADA